jgi:hypothetical protein
MNAEKYIFKENNKYYLNFSLYNTENDINIDVGDQFRVSLEGRTFICKTVHSSLKDEAYELKIVSQ